MVFILDAKLTNGSSTSSSGEDNKEEESECDSEEEKEELKHQSSSVGQYDKNTEYTTYITIHNNNTGAYPILKCTEILWLCAPYYIRIISHRTLARIVSE